ncbi:MAG: hypothetical protein Q9175_003123, partial [Cornicularia normoerica]
MPLRVKAKLYFCLKGLTLRNSDPLDEIDFGTHLNKVQSKLTELFEKAQELDEDESEERQKAPEAYQKAEAGCLTQLESDKNKRTAPCPRQAAGSALQCR